MQTRREFFVASAVTAIAGSVARVFGAKRATNAPAAEAQKTVNGALHSINVSLGGVPKNRVQSAEITKEHVVGDAQRNTKAHGGPDRAVTLFCLDQINAFQKQGHPIGVGTTGENLTLDGIPNALLTPGARVKVGSTVELEITKYLPPCGTIKGSFKDGDFMLVSHAKHPGCARVGARVITPGTVKIGDAVTLLRA